MHPNPAFRGVEAARNLAFARQEGFGVLTLAGAGGPLASHLPFVVNEDGDRLGAHIVRSNPIWRQLRGGDASGLMVVSGPHGYISPDWYGAEDQVPTWNYVAVHLRGSVRILPDDALKPHLDALSAEFERRLAPKPEWLIDKVAEDPLARLMRMIAPIEMDIEAIEGTWKLNQNKEEDSRLMAADSIEALGSDALAALMRDPPA